MPDEFTCHNCNSQSVVYPEQWNEDARVVCRGCGTPLATMAQFRNRIERHRREATISGC
jgi:transcription elongation factor Elf1